MPPIIKTLSMRATGDDVIVLHDALQKMGYSVPDSEKAKKYFGAATRETVKEFQNKYGLNVTGEVDKATADLLNGLVIGGIAPGSSPVVATTYSVKGRVASNSRAGVGGLRVEIVDKNLAKDDVSLKEGLTDSEGNYQVTFTIPGLQARGKTNPDLQARVFSGTTFLGCIRCAL